MFVSNTGFSIFITVALTIVGLAFLYLKILPKKFDGSFGNKILQVVHDYFHFKKLYLESVLKFLFVVVTVACIAVGVSTILSTFLGVFRSIRYIIDGYMPFRYLFTSFFRGMFGGALTIVVGPIVVRLVYEGIMMFILLVKNVIEINNKTKKDNNTIEEVHE